MNDTQRTTPILLRDNRTIELQRIPFSESGFSEDWLQDLLYRNPKLLPVQDIEIVFGDLIPLARELPTAAGPVDLLYVNKNGFITLVETKLWRNPESRRKVVAQIIDYAKELARWSYNDFASAVSSVWPDVSANGGLVKLVAETVGVDEFDEVAFIDTVSRNLKRGRFLLLIVGDGIQEGVQQMTDFLQRTPQLGFTFGLVEIAVFRTDPENDDELFIQPRILARTQEVVRAVVEINVTVPPSSVKVTLPPEPNISSPRQPLTEEQFLDQLREKAPDAVEFAQWVLAQAENSGLAIKWGGGGPLIQYVDGPTGEFFTFGQLNRSGFLDTLWSLPYRCEQLGLPERIWRDYWKALEELIPDTSIKEFKKKDGKSTWGLVYGPNPKPGSLPPLKPLGDHREEWFELMTTTIERIRHELNNR